MSTEPTTTPGGILIPAPPPPAPPSPATIRHNARVRGVILTALRRLSDDLGDFEQTTHGCIFPHGNPIRGLGGPLANALECPSAYNISELAQHLAAVLRGYKDAPAGPEQPRSRPPFFRSHEPAAFGGSVLPAIEPDEDPA